MAKIKKNLTEEEKEIIKRIDDLIVIRSYLKIQKEDEENRTEWLKKFVGENPTDIIENLKIWSKDDRKTLHLAIVTPGYERPVEKEKLINLLGLENAVKVLESVSFTRLTELAKNKLLVGRDGKSITILDLERIFPSREKPEGSKLTVKIYPTGTEVKKVIKKGKEE